MKRDMDLLRDLLIRIEEGDDGSGKGVEIDPGEWSPQVISGHLRLLVEAGLIEAHEIPDRDDEDLTHYEPKRLTWLGQEFLAAVRDKEIWKQTKAAARKGGVEAIGAIWDIAKAIGKAQLKRRLDLEF